MNFRTLDLNLLRVFDEVMAERNLTRAAKNLSMTQPAVSNSLRRLRDALGDDLVVRSGYGVVPTQQALKIWPAVREALSSLRGILQPDEFDPTRGNTSFTLAMADATAALLIPPMVYLIESEAPGVTLRVLPLSTRDPRDLLESSEIDAAIGYFPVALAESALDSAQHGGPDSLGSERLYEGHHLCVMRHDHPLAGKPLTLDEFCAAHHLLVSFSGRAFGFVDQALAAIKRSRRVVLTVNQFFTAGRVVANSDLLTVLPEHFISATGFRDKLAIFPLPLDVPSVHVDMLWHRRHENRPAHRWLRDAVLRSHRQSVLDRRIASR
ncbi:MAG: LysR family transcriptional regulator [Burkholderiaceae bacterium]